MAQQGRNERCQCGSGRKVKRCCGVRRGPSEAELAKAFLHQQARSAALVLDSRSDDEVVALLDAAVGLPKQDVSMQLPLPGLLSPALERLCAAVADDDPDEVAAAVPAVLAEVDTPIVRAGLVRAVQGLRDAGRVSDEVAAAVLVEQASRSTELLTASLLAAVAVGVGAATHAGWAAGGQPLVSRPSPFAVSLTASQRRVLEGRLRRPTAQQREVVRARIVLAAADGEQNIRIAGRLGVAVNTVSKWRKRFVEEGLGGLGDRKRPGRPRRFPLGGGGGGQGDRL